MKGKKSSLGYAFSLWITIAIFFALVAFEVLQFRIWNQILELEGTSFLVEQYWSVAHAPRYFVVTTTIEMVSSVTGVDANKAFSFVVALNMVLSVLSLAATRERLAIESNPTSNYLGVVSLLTITYFMNGRLSFSFLGVSLVLFSSTITNADLKSVVFKIILIVVGLSWATVSSGSFTVAYLTVIGVSFYQHFDNERFKGVYRVLVLGVLAIVTPAIVTSFVKNIDYYGGGGEALVRMTAHGYGVFLSEVPETILLFLGLFISPLALAGAHLFVRKFRSTSRRPLFIAASCSVAVGVYGWSTLLSGLIPLGYFAIVSLSHLILGMMRR